MRLLGKLLAILLVFALALNFAGCGSNGISAEFKETMDAYEEFFDEYIAFMKKYQENPSDLALLSDYSRFMTKYTAVMSEIANMENQKMNTAEEKYYLEVTGRIASKLANILVSIPIQVSETCSAAFCRAGFSILTKQQGVGKMLL